MKNNKINITIIITILVSLISYIILKDGVYNFISTLKQIKVNWLILACIFMVIYLLAESLVLHIITKKVCRENYFLNSLKISMVGQLFNNLTPFSSGGQPMQAVTMVKSGIKVSNSINILLFKFIIFQTVLVSYTTLIFIFKYTYFKQLVSNFISLSVIGFTVNLFVIVILILSGLNNKLMYNIIKNFYKFLCKIKILKDIESKLEKLRKDLDMFHKEFENILKEKMLIFKTIFITFIGLTSLCLVTYAVYKSFGQTGNSIINIISAQMFLMMIMAFIPIPGASGAAEGGFYIIFNTFFSSSKIKIAILIWRLITFYLPIVIGAIFFVVKLDKLKIFKLVTQGNVLNEEEVNI